MIILINIVKTIRTQFQRKIPTNPPLGRWNVEYCINKVGAKIDLANEDHCGSCNHYLTHIVKNIQLTATKSNT